MGITSSNKQISASQIECDGTLKVTLALSASPDILSSPTDTVLILDRSGSMAGAPLDGMKKGAETFIDIISEATGGAQDGIIGAGSRIGIVSFSDMAAADTQLITSVSDLKEAVDGLEAGGFTNHADAFAKAMALFPLLSDSGKIMVMFTDGKTTAGGPPDPVAAAARAAGIIIYCIGLVGTDGIDVDTLNQWATDPDASHVAVTPDAADLEELFAGLAENISRTGATNIVIDEVIDPDFTILSVSPPVRGTAMMINSNTLQWKISELGVKGNEGASLEFLIRHRDREPGVKKVNKSIQYSDTEGNKVIFPDPEVRVDCGIIIDPEPCPEPVEMTLRDCQDFMEVDAGEMGISSTGSVIQMNVTLKHVCPNKRVALAAVLTEVDDAGKEHSRGMKTITVPAHHHMTRRDIQVRNIRFVLPDEPDSLCSHEGCRCRLGRKLKARFFANTIDTDFECHGHQGEN